MIVAMLKLQGISIGRFKVRRIMRQLGLISRQKHNHRYQLSFSELPALANQLNRNFSPEKPNKVWTSDITYIWTGRQWSYLAIILDLFTRRIIGHAFSNRADSSLVLLALEMAWQNRHPPKYCVFHSDQGSQYTSQQLRNYLKQHHMVQSMSRRGNCWDNAPTERVFRSLKTERVPKSGYRNIDEAKADITDYLMNYYNYRRPHSYNQGLPPAINENRLLSMSENT